MKKMLGMCVLLGGLAACGNNNADNNGNTVIPDPGNNQQNSTANNTNTGPNTGPNTQPNNTSNNTQPNNSTSNNTQTGPNSSSNTQTGPNTTTVNSQPGDLCSSVQDLGMLSQADSGLKLDGTTTSATLVSSVATPCGFGSAPEVSYLLSFEKGARVKAKLTASSTSWVMDLRGGDCMGSESISCLATSDRTFVVGAGESRILTLEPENNARGTFSLELEITDLECTPIGGSMCSGDDISICEGGKAQNIYTCGEACSMDFCGGDICENAIAVRSFPYTFTGKTEKTYRSRLDFGDATACNYPDGGAAFPTPGEDVTFSLPGLQAGQKLTVDASPEAGNMSDSAIFVLESCDKSTCKIGRDLGDKLEGWEVPAAGDYTVVVDRRSGSLADIVVKIDVQ